MPIKSHLSPVFLLTAVIFLVYCDSFNNSFIYDDHPFVVENKATRSLGIRNLVSFFCDRDTVSASQGLSRDVWRPFMTMSFAIDYRLWKLKARYYHIENTLFHAINAVLVFILILSILNDVQAAFVASLVFAIHPAQTEAVTWVSGRSNVLFLFFFLIAFLFHIRNKRRRESAISYSLSIIFFLAALFSKEIAIILPAMLIMYDACLCREKTMKYYIAYYFPFMIVAVFYLLARFSVLGTFAQRTDWAGGDIFSGILTTLKALGEYIRIAFVPIGPKVFHLTDAPVSVFSPDVVIAILIISFIAALYAMLRHNRIVSFFILWFFIALIPVSNIVPFKAVIAERFLYLPLIGFAALFGILFSAILRNPKPDNRMRAGLGIVFIGIILSYVFLTVSRNVEWRNELTFYMQEAARSPKDPTAHYNFAVACEKEARKHADHPETALSYYALAIEEHRKAVVLKPTSYLAYAGLANACNEAGFYDEAVKNFRKALAISESGDLYNNLAVAYLHTGRYGEAVLACKKAIYIRPDHLSAFVNLGNAFFMKKEYEKARLAWQRALKIGGHDIVIEQKIADLGKV